MKTYFDLGRVSVYQGAILCGSEWPPDDVLKIGVQGGPEGMQRDQARLKPRWFNGSNLGSSVFKMVVPMQCANYQMPRAISHI